MEKPSRSTIQLSRRIGAADAVKQTHRPYGSAQALVSAGLALCNSSPLSLNNTVNGDNLLAFNSEDLQANGAANWSTSWNNLGLHFPKSITRKSMKKWLGGLTPVDQNKMIAFIEIYQKLETHSNVLKMETDKMRKKEGDFDAKKLKELQESVQDLRLKTDAISTGTSDPRLQACKLAICICLDDFSAVTERPSGWLEIFPPKNKEIQDGLETKERINKFMAKIGSQNNVKPENSSLLKKMQKKIKETFSR